MEKTGHIEQAGRAESSLEAERNTAELRSKGSSPTESRDSSGSTLQRGTSSTPEQLPTPVLSRRASYVPAVPSPLNSSSSHSSISDSDEKTNIEKEEGISPVESLSSNEVSRTLSPSNVPSNTGTARKSSTLSPAQHILRQKTASAFLSRSVQPETPRRLKDLGRDYSRYPLSSADLRSQSSLRRESVQRAERPSLLRTTTTNPFSDSEADIEKWGYPDDSLGNFDPYFGKDKGYILYANEIEPDDIYHQPADDDDEVYKAKWSDHFQRRSIVSTIGAIFLIIGLLCVFIVLPVVTFTTDTFFPGGSIAYNNTGWTGPAWAHVNNKTYALLRNVRKGLIDPDTPASAMTRKSSFDGSTLNLVFSDEFNEDNRTFYPGDDPFWTGADLWYGATQDMEWYDPDAITTGGGTLQLRMDSFYNHNLPFRSGMLNSWNQLCFKGGVFEVSVSLAGPAGVPGLWPGIWTMGNLGRPGYKATTEGVWPYTYNSCDWGITPNQSSPDGVSYLPGQKLSSCSCKGEDHPSPGTGRGAPEIDILEGSVDPNNKIGIVTQSFQVAPFDVYWRPNSNFLAIPNYDTTQMNGYTGGPYQQAISGTTLLDNQWYNGTQYQKYSFEYIPGTSTGKIAWFVGEDPSFIMDGRAIGPNGNVGARVVSQEPMSMVLNLGISGAWSEILMADLVFPTIMHIDYVRIYQKAGQENITCDPPGYPTTEYIKNHLVAYNNPNLTVSVLALFIGMMVDFTSRGLRRTIRGRRTH